MRRTSRLYFCILLLLGVALTFFKIPLASSQGLTLVATRVEGDLPVEDLASPLWQQATALEVPLSAQNVAKPFLLESKVRSVTARLLHNETQIAILVEWADETKDESSVRIQDFRDSVAVQFPQVEGQPFFCMGQPGSNVNIWHWKADWQADIAARQDVDSQYADMYVDQYPYANAAQGIQAGLADYSDPNYLPAMEVGNLFASASLASPVEDLNAGSFGTLTAQAKEGQNVQGYGSWADGKWSVMFSRELGSQETDDITFDIGKTYSIAFAVWDGSNGERNGQKSTSQWVSLLVESAPESPTVEEPGAAEETSLFTTDRIKFIIIGVLVLFFLAVQIIFWRLPK
jgi:DMSO reductase family type II enzyme heme b subunit